MRGKAVRPTYTIACMAWRLCTEQHSSLPWLCIHRRMCPCSAWQPCPTHFSVSMPSIHGSSIRFVLQKQDWSEQVNHPLSCHCGTVCGQLTGHWHASFGSLKSQSEIWIPLPVIVSIGIVLVHSLVWPGAPLITSFFTYLVSS